jgi:predicted PurR-regulated permease PerM
MTQIWVGVVVVAALYFGREVLVPIALAILLSFVLSPLVRLLQRGHFPRSVAVIAVGLVAFAAIFGLGALMVSQVNGLATDLPRYQATLGAKIDSLRGATAGTSTLERASEVLHDLKKEIDRPKGDPAPSLSGGAEPQKPIPVEVRQPDPGALQTLTILITPLIHPLATTGIVAIFVIFILLQHQDLRNRLVRLAGAQDLQRTTVALDDAGERLSRLFLTQLGLNAGFGFIIGVGLWLIGVPSAPLWGLLAMILRFVPYIGAVISAIFPLVLAAAVGPSWTMVLWTAALFLIVEPIAGQVVEPLVYGHSAGLSPVAVIVSATFWTWLWGPIGLILATPLTICLVVLGRHVDRLKFLDIMFGDEPPLKPAELIYQRMLARDPVEAAEQAQSFLRERPLTAFYDEVMLEGLHLAQRDADRGLLDDERTLQIRDAVAEIIDDLSAHQDSDEIVQQEDALKLTQSPLAQLHKAEA